MIKLNPIISLHVFDVCPFVWLSALCEQNQAGTRIGGPEILVFPKTLSLSKAELGSAQLSLFVSSFS